MLVTRENWGEAKAYLAKCEALALDTETTGLYPYQGDRPFSIILGDDSRQFYISRKAYPEENVEPFTPPDLSEVLTRSRLWYLHNAKFDLHHLAQAGFRVEGTIHCAEALGRVERNNRLSYSLDNLGRELGFEKDGAVAEYIRNDEARRGELVRAEIRRWTEEG